MNEKQNCLRLILNEAHDGRFNMAADELLLKNQIQRKDENAVLRFYRFSEPTLTIGYGVWKSAEKERAGQTPFVRRITGGGIVSHKTSDLTYAFIAPYASFLSLKKTRGSYMFIHETLKRALVDFGIRTSFYENCSINVNCHPERSEGSANVDSSAALQNDKPNSNYCFESPVLYDVMLKEKKVAGAGQKRTSGYLLHQGSIAWDLLTEVESTLSEADFCCSFAKHLAKALNLSVNETSFRAEVLEALAASV